jgi:hypothetical protein
MSSKSATIEELIIATSTTDRLVHHCTVTHGPHERPLTFLERFGTS